MFVEMAKTKPFRMGPLKDEAFVRIAVGKAEAIIAAARSFLFQTLEIMWEVLINGDTLQSGLRRQFRIMVKKVCDDCMKVIDMLYHTAGASVVYEDHPLYRCFLDAHTAYQHVILLDNVYEEAGQHIFEERVAAPFF